MKNLNLFFLIIFIIIFLSLITLKEIYSGQLGAKISPLKKSSSFLQIIAPKEGEVIEFESQYNFRWLSKNVKKVSLRLINDEKNKSCLIASNIRNRQNYLLEIYKIPNCPPSVLIGKKIRLEISSDNIKTRSGYFQIKSTAPKSFFVKGAYGIEAKKVPGFNTQYVTYIQINERLLDELYYQGVKAIVDLGGYDYKNCQFELPDHEVRKIVKRFKNHPAILYWQIADEPNGDLATCPDIINEFKKRIKLIKLIDPEAKVYTVLMISCFLKNTNGEIIQKYFADCYRDWNQSDLFDVYGFDVYICGRKKNDSRPWPQNVTCDFSELEKAKKAILEIGFKNFIAVIGAFEQCWEHTGSCYALPSGEQLEKIFQSWLELKDKGLNGYMIYHWTQQYNEMTDWCGNRDECVKKVIEINKKLNH